MATVVIIPGSFAKPTLYERLVQSLARDGIQSEIVDLPSVGRKEGKAPATLSDDVDEIASVVEKILDEDKEVILLAHSYGGVPATQSLETLSQKARQSQGKKSGVTKIVYLAAVALPVGGSVLALLTAQDYLIIEAKSPPEEALKLARELPQHSTASYRDQLTYAGYQDAEVHYIICEQDKLVVPEYQFGMLEILKGMTNGNVGVHKIQSGHAPHINHPDNLTKIIRQIVD
ncbi:hypothetical protein FGSG_03500 [Fusarium graminearum PH-1]|uniref:hypothetical protein n=1 Tax=Gibberella zeae (strain ATCC MYA-4620 / CBS 123657 / FGSC 9075 / NRRL 31084 / PH-1) TaxID=229533 RepID=UPI00021F13CD|nr:hypothetical protein FGSG_03500 [Fusarium graminearum PH-1]ESU09713.1 hypothetical protein FGSG_03500 [Fusarium graminearum PH-1]EYB25458.1 hypothetical protein FG05_03500 [Fusarium graminearum]|eukprot:XP_011322212.1 hypothetical protein FGSG_03500 [Fusarium graminearum PH-1]